MTRLMDGNNDANTRRTTDGHGWRPCIMRVVLPNCGAPPSGNAPVDLWVSKMAIQECRLHSQPVQWDRERTNQAETDRCMSHDFGQSCTHQPECRTAALGRHPAPTPSEYRCRSLG